MGTSDAGLSDEVHTEVNGRDTSNRIPDRPSTSAKKARWVEYVVALGMHPDAAKELTADELIGMADGLGG